MQASVHDTRCAFDVGAANHWLGHRATLSAKRTALTRISMHRRRLRVAIALACLVFFSKLAAQESYHDQAEAAADRRAEISLVQFEAKLQESKTLEDQSTNRILLSFTKLTPAREIISEMISLGIGIEELQLAAGEEMFSFPFDHVDPDETPVKLGQQANFLLDQRRNELKNILKQQLMDVERHWLLESRRFLDAYQVIMDSSDTALISGASCVASTGQIEQLIARKPTLIRAIEFLGVGTRRMSIPLEFYNGSK